MLILFLLAVLPSFVWAKPKPEPRQKKGHYSLIFSGATGYSSFLNQGTSPVLFEGPVLMPGLTFNWDRRAWNFAFDNQLNVGYLKDQAGSNSNFSTTAGYLFTRFSALHRSFFSAAEPDSQTQDSRWSYSLGPSLVNVVFLSQNASLQNASVGFSEAFLPALRMELSTGYFVTSRARTWKWSAAAEIAPIGWFFHHGYAYLDNFTAGTNSSQLLFSTYQWQHSALPMLSASLGFARRLASGNSIALRYRWTLLNDHAQQADQFLMASHLLDLQFHFSIR